MSAPGLLARALPMCAASLAILFAGLGAARVEAARIVLDVATEEGITVATIQQWHRLLTDLGVDDLQIRPGEINSATDITSTGRGTATTHRVKGILTARGDLLLRGGRFSKNDRARLATWLSRLREQGPEAIAAGQSLPFGLPAKELAMARKLLAAPCEGTTQGVAPTKIVDRCRRALSGNLRIDPQASRALSGADDVADELQGLSCGTVLAAVLAPLDLALAPRRDEAGEIEFRIVPRSATGESWPVGSSAESRRRELVPALFDTRNVEVEGVSVDEALRTVVELLELPLVYDRAGLGQRGIDPTQLPAKLPSRRTSLSRVLQAVSFQARLKAELRVDEADHPFLWVAPVKAP